jgi:hypothetical protein
MQRLLKDALHWQKLSMNWQKLSVDVQDVWLLSRRQTQGRKTDVNKEGAIGGSMPINPEFTSSSNLWRSIKPTALDRPEAC